MSRLSSISTLLLSTGTAVAAFEFSSRSLKTPTKLDANSLAVPLEDDASTSRPIFDPLGLYPNDSPERDLIRPLEFDDPTYSRLVIDPLNIYPSKDCGVDTEVDMSLALPFVARPKHLDGTMAGDFGFDPLGLAAAGDNSADRLNFMREAEIKHGRIAMLAALGWPVAELLNTKLAFALGLKPLLQFGNRVPSVLNGGLGHTMADYWPYMAATLALGGGIEAFTEYEKREAAEAGLEPRQPGNLGFDPIGIYKGQENLEVAEIKHGRLAMMAISFFAFQEACTQTGVVSELASMLHPQSLSIEDLSNLPVLFGTL